MNKYEEALRELYYQFRRYPKDKNIEFLIELVKRATPTKPNNIEKHREFMVGRCPRCNNLCGSIVKYCPDCGQALDWSGETK